MRTAIRILGYLAALSACAEQPKPNCITSSAPYAAKLIERARTESVPGACSGFGPASFQVDARIGLATYFARDGKGQPDYARGSIGLQSAELGGLLATAHEFDQDNADPNGEVYSLGAFSGGEPDAEDFCRVPSTSPAHLLLPQLPAMPDDPATEEADGFPGQPAQDITLSWSDVRVYVTAASLGTQVQGELVDRRLTPSGTSCEISYRVLALTPAVSCAQTDDEGEPVRNPDGSLALDPTLCDPTPKPDLGRPTGSGINPNTRYVCDPVSAMCVLDGDTVPALQE